MRRAAAIACVLLCGSSVMAEAQERRWSADVAGALLLEAWDLNAGRESLRGAFAGVEREIGAGFAARAEASLLHVAQAGPDAWQRGAALVLRWQAGQRRLRPYVDIGAGWASAALPVPPGGTRGNYLLVAGGGVEVPMAGRLSLRLGGRWHHVSNNGREGNHVNPDIQALGLSAGLAWAW